MRKLSKIIFNAILNDRILIFFFMYLLYTKLVKVVKIYIKYFKAFVISSYKNLENFLVHIKRTALFKELYES